MRTLLLVVLAWSGVAAALDLPVVPADALVETEVCDTQLQAEILVSKDTPSSSESKPSRYEGVRCTWTVDGTEYTIKDGVRESQRVVTRVGRRVRAVGSREVESREVDVAVSGGLKPASRLTRTEDSIYEIVHQTKTLVSRMIDGQAVDIQESTSLVSSGDLRVFTTSGSSGKIRYSDSGDRAKIESLRRTCTLTRVKDPCPSVPTS